MKFRLFAFTLLFLVPLVAYSADVALEGNCAVCLVEVGKVVAGSEQHAITFDRQVYYFPSDAEKKMFAANPVKYAPALGGDCAVCRANMGVRMSGKVEFRVIHNGRTFLFPSAKEQEAFKADPQKYQSVDFALQGHCAVCLAMAKKLVLGKTDHVIVYDGKRYYFPSAEEQKTFDAGPARFAPALDGDCVVCLKDGGKRVEGLPQFSATHENRLYLFPDAAAQKTFSASPEAYAGVDVAHGGNCVVCSKMAGKTMPGKAEFASTYMGRRYLFPSAKERAMFDAAPAEYVDQAAKVGAAPATEINVVGKAACAACGYGIRPITDSNSLGIAVVTADTVYVVEAGEKRFPDLFAARFDGMQVELKGTLKKKEGKFVWVEPSSLTKSR